MLNELCLRSIILNAKQQASRTKWKSEISCCAGICLVYTGYLLPFNQDKTHWVIAQIFMHATNTDRDIPCTNISDWVITCLSPVCSDRTKDIPGITLWSAYTLYIPGINPDKPSYPTDIRFQMYQPSTWQYMMVWIAMYCNTCLYVSSVLCYILW